MESFIFTRENKNETINAVDLRNIKMQSARWEHQLCYGAKPKDFTITIEEFKKTKSWKQVKGIHRMCSLLAIRLKESNGIDYDLESAKLWVKYNFAYTRPATEQECIAEAINQRNIQLCSGRKVSRADFMKMVESFRVSLLKAKSFKDAAMEELTELIKKIEELGNKMGWTELKLTSEEDRSMREFYEEPAMA